MLQQWRVSSIHIKITLLKVVHLTLFQNGDAVFGCAEINLVTKLRKK